MESRRSPTSPALDGGIRKRMRKGTHSCFECRRRKIRCIFAPNNPRVCTECFGRGSQCIDQESADPGIVLDQRKNLRERVARLEDLVNSILDEKTDSKAALTLAGFRSEPSPPTPLSGESMSPASSAQPAAPHPWTSMSEKTSIHRQSGAAFDQFLQLYPTNQGQKKTQQVLDALKKLLPSHEKLQLALDSNKNWWKSITSAMVRPGVTPNHLTDLHAYAEFALSAGSPMDVAKILQLVCSSGNLQDQEIEAILDCISQYIINDDEYMGTLSGVEVAHWQARHYGDIGQSRRAWLVIRRAVSFAQLMGLHRNRVNLRQDLAFWGLYQFDRLISLVLGVPYAIADVHCNLSAGPQEIPVIFRSYSFLSRLATIAGKVIDRTHGPQSTSQDNKDSSLESLIAIDRELMDLKATFPMNYWDLESVAPRAFEGSFDWMQRCLSGTMFNQTRLILHIPNLFRPSNPSSNDSNSHPSSRGDGVRQPEYSRHICLELSRSTLQTFQIARAPVNAFVYKTIAIDFLGVIAAVVLVIDIINQRSLHNTSVGGPRIQLDETERRADWNLVQMALDTYCQAEKLPFGKIATQARKVLTQLLNFKDPTVDHSEPSKILIPFFGIITIYSGKVQEADTPTMGGKADVRANSLSASHSPSVSEHYSATDGDYTLRHPAVNMGASAYTPNLRSPTLAASAMSPPMHAQGISASNLSHLLHTPPQFSIPRGSESQIAYDGVYMSHENPNFVYSDGGMLGKVRSAHFGNPWPNVGTFDLDQDWAWLMSQAQAEYTENS